MNEPLAGRLFDPFEHLTVDGLPEGPNTAPHQAQESVSIKKGRVEIRRDSKHRNGKIVTTVQGLETLPPEDQSILFKKLQRACGVGGSYQQTPWIFQGDQRDILLEYLLKEGFKAVKMG